jgi:L-ascorbate metabolism protein UlaG (beta-lactamase superfamily)
MRVLKRIGAALLFIVVGLCLAPTIVPPFLDRIYYSGPDSGHFGEGRFFNPGASGAPYGLPQRFFNRWASDTGRATWPERVAVHPTVPPRSVQGTAMRVTWIGHATALVQTQGLNILTDPIWSERASPFRFIGPKRVRAPGVRFEHLPRIDLILISHNHYDHLDLPTLQRLWRRDRPLIITSLGNDSILKQAGIDSRALDWGGRVAVKEGVEVIVARNHHWSSRWGTDRNRALWSAFTIRLPGGNFFYAGDTGFGDGSWVREAAADRPFRLAIIPIGAYEPRDFMKTNHVNPEEAVRIHQMLSPLRSLGIHWGTFQLTFEPIGQPVQRLEMLKARHKIPANDFVAVEAGGSFEVPPL